MFSMQCRKNIKVEDNKKRMNIANFMDIYIYTNIYLYVTRITQNKNDSIKSRLQHGRAVGRSRCVVFPTSGFPYWILYLKRCKWKVATTYLAIRTKSN